MKKIIFEIVTYTVLAHLTLVTLTFDSSIKRVPLLYRMDVWDKFEEGRSRRSRVIDRKKLQPDRPTNRHVQSNNEGGHNNLNTLLVTSTLFHHQLNNTTQILHDTVDSNMSHSL